MASTTAVTTVPTHSNYTSAASHVLPGGVVYPADSRSGKADYVAIATVALNRGFRITPVHLTGPIFCTKWNVSVTPC
jgi:hypothetical protein